MAPKTVYVHVGLHKTGTTYLQNVLRANRKQLRGQDVYFPGGKGEPVQAFAVWDLQGRQPRGVSDRRIAGTWQRLVDAVNSTDQSTALISEERLSLATLKQASTAVHAFPDSEVHVVVTARDLGARRGLRLAGGDQERPDLDLATVRGRDQGPGPRLDQPGPRILATPGPGRDLCDVGGRGPAGAAARHHRAPVRVVA